MDGYLFRRSGLLVQVGPNGQGWRLDTAEALGEYGPQEGWSPLPTRILAGYSAKPMDAPGWVIATGSVPENTGLKAFVNQDGSPGQLRPKLLGTRPPRA